MAATAIGATAPIAWTMWRLRKGWVRCAAAAGWTWGGRRCAGLRAIDRTRRGVRGGDGDHRFRMLLRRLGGRLDSLRRGVAGAADAEQQDHVLRDFDELARFQAEDEVHPRDHEREDEELETRQAGLRDLR